MLLAGFPCSLFPALQGVEEKCPEATPRFRLRDARHAVLEVERIIAAHRPKAFLLENVKNLVNHDRGRTFDVIYRTLTQKLGYKVQWKVVDAKSFVPQHRERIFIVGFREDNDFTFDDLDLPDPLNGPRLKSILHPEDGSETATTGLSLAPAAM
ncbi:MAG: DNA (cytosine-5-)-methyltransferase [Hyphomicrobiales bacterium]